MNEHFVVTLDGGHLRIYAEQREVAQWVPRLLVVEAMDFPDIASASVPTGEGARLIDFPLDGGQSTPRHANAEPVKSREQIARNVLMLADEINTFLQNRPEATWDFAAPTPVYEAILDELSVDAIQRLQRSLSRDLMNHDAEEVRVQFAAVGF